MNTLAKLIASIAALVASLALAWIAKDGVTVRHAGSLTAKFADVSGRTDPTISILHY